MFHPSIIEPDTYKTLQSIFESDEINKNFALAGGTSLALQLRHRHSIDLDIFSPYPINTRNIELSISSSPALNFQLVNSNKNMLFAFVNSIKCDFIYEPSKLLQPFVVNDHVNYFHVNDIAAMKLHTICGRGRKKDFFDMYVLIENFGWQNILKWFGEKYDDSQLYFLWRSIVYFTDADEDPDIKGIAPYTKSWKQIKEYIKKNCT